MKRTAFLVNVARGAIVDETALCQALTSGEIAGAGPGVFVEEPARAENPLLAVDNVIASSHAVGWTDECRRLCSEGVAASVMAVLQDRAPADLYDRDVLRHPRLASIAR